MRTHWTALPPLLALAVACNSTPTPPQPAASASAPSASAASVAAAAPSASAAPVKFPPEARRNSAPVGIDASALAVGKSVPKLEGVSATTGSFTRSNDKLTVLVFYRGNW